MEELKQKEKEIMEIFNKKIKLEDNKYPDLIWLL